MYRFANSCRLIMTAVRSESTAYLTLSSLMAPVAPSPSRLRRELRCLRVDDGRLDKERSGDVGNRAASATIATSTTAKGGGGRFDRLFAYTEVYQKRREALAR